MLTSQMSHVKDEAAQKAAERGSDRQHLQLKTTEKVLVEEKNAFVTIYDGPQSSFQTVLVT